MKITNNVIEDLFPLYAANECSTDSRALVDEYLNEYPEKKSELQRFVTESDFGRLTTMKLPLEVKALRRARGQVRLQSGLMAIAIFLCLAPFSFVHTEGRTYWMFANSPIVTCVYGSLGVVTWIVYFMVRKNLQVL